MNPRSEPLRVAIGPENGPFRAVLQQMLGDVLSPASSGQQGEPVVGLVVQFDNDAESWAQQAATILDRHGSCRGIVVANSKPEVLVKGLRPTLQIALLQSMRIIPPNGSMLERILNGIHEIQEAVDSPTQRSALNRAFDVIQAKRLYARLAKYCHGSKTDITNQVLGPLRMLLLSNNHETVDEEWKSYRRSALHSFNKELFPCHQDRWWLESALRFALEEIISSNIWDNGTDVRSTVSHLERFMDLLTDCRGLAGGEHQTADSKTVAVAPVIPRVRGEEICKVLVIDDHAEAWRPVFQKLQDFMASSGTDPVFVAFEFWTGQEPRTENSEPFGDLLPLLPSYDAVLLDVYLGRGLDGRVLLKEVRRHYVNLPIVVWTTSRTPDLPAEAQLAHGFLFKKSTRFEQMAGLLAERFREGNAKRRYALPGHFFDHSLRSSNNRKLALRFTEYCSKQLDSFHALDEQYFRFFTDHGGRHILKLIEYLGDFLRPLIRNPACFATGNDEQRELEILSLYLAVFLHEFGMLRLQGENEPAWDALDSEKLQQENSLVRALHAVRVMVMLADKSLTHWPDEEGRYQASTRFWSTKAGCYLVKATALITGYHARVLPIPGLEEKNVTFGRWSDVAQLSLGKKAARALNKDPDKPEDREAALNELSGRFFSVDRIQHTLEDLVKGIPFDQLERLQRQSAVFRFVDAIDVDHTRNPAEFLCLNANIGALDRREAMKRQVVREVHTEGGFVRIETSVSCPARDVLKAILGNDYPDPAIPWDGEFDQPRIRKTKACQGTLDDWLKRFWEKPSAVEPRSFLKFDGQIVSDDSKILIAEISALSVAWEIIDEYEAIVNCRLENVVRLVSFDWHPRGDIDENAKWRQKQKNMFTMLFHENGLDAVCRQSNKAG